MGIDPEDIKDVDEWIKLYTQADYVMKLERKIQYSAMKQALAEVVSELFRKDED